MFNLTDTCISLPQRECNRHKRLQPHYDLTVPMQSLLTGLKLNAQLSLYPDKIENQVESVKNTTRTQSDRVCYRLKTRKAITRVHQLVREGHKILIFMRGCPGSGKSTLARSIATNEQIVSADNYLFGKDKKYEYNSFKVAQAHEKCFVAVRDLMETCKNPIILDNTNLSLNDMIPATLQPCFIQVPNNVHGSRVKALTFEYRIMFMEPDTFWRYDIHTLSRKTLHNVPRYKIAQMLKRFDRNITYETLVSSALRSIWNPFEYRYTSKVNMNRNAYFEKADTPVNTAIHKSIDCSYVNNETLVETVESTIDIEGTCVPIEDEIEESANLKSLTIKDTNLRDKFPDIPDHLIEHLLDLCNNDYLLAESIIKESGFTHITKQPVALAIVDSANVSNPIDKADNSSSGCDVDTKQISSNVDNTLLLTLDYNFIDKLEVLFGKIKFPLNIATTKSSNDQRAYLLPLEIYEADKLYRLLTLINRRLCNEDIYEFTNNFCEEGVDENFASIPTQLTYETNDGKPTYAAVTLKGDLYRKFPQFDDFIIESIFKSCRYNARYCEQCLEYLARDHIQPNVNSGLSEANVIEQHIDTSETNDINYERENKKYKEALKKARHGYSQRMYGVAQYYADDARKHLHLCQQALSNQESAIHHNQLQIMDSTNVLDLHGYSVSSALLLLKKALNKRTADLTNRSERCRSKRIAVITGWGKHSAMNFSKLRETVESFLFNNNYVFRQSEYGTFSINLA